MARPPSTPWARLRLLCAHRDGPAGATTWNARAEQWLADLGEGPPPEGGWYLGRPVIVTENDYGLGLFNGDTGAVIAHGEADEVGGSLRVAFRRGSRRGDGEPRAAGSGRDRFRDDGAQSAGV